MSLSAGGEGICLRAAGRLGQKDPFIWVRNESLPGAFEHQRKCVVSSTAVACSRLFSDILKGGHSACVLIQYFTVNEVLPGTSAPANALPQTNSTLMMQQSEGKNNIHEHGTFSMN